MPPETRGCEDGRTGRTCVMAEKILGKITTEYLKGLCTVLYVGIYGSVWV